MGELFTLYKRTNRFWSAFFNCVCSQSTECSYSYGWSKNTLKLFHCWLKVFVLLIGRLTNFYLTVTIST